MEKERVVAYILRLLWRDYGIKLCPQEQPIFALKLYFALEGLEQEARQTTCQRLHGQVSAN